MFCRYPDLEICRIERMFRPLGLFCACLSAEIANKGANSYHLQGWIFFYWNKDICPLGTGLKPAAHFTQAAQQLPDRNNVWSLLTWARFRRVTQRLKPQYPITNSPWARLGLKTAIAYLLSTKMNVSLDCNGSSLLFRRGVTAKWMTVLSYWGKNLQQRWPRCSDTEMRWALWFSWWSWKWVVPPIFVKFIRSSS